jgi:hypothetical protein
VAAEVQEDPAENTRLAKATAAVFSSWTGALADGFVGLGVDRTRAKSLSTLMIASIEGAVVICRAQRSTAALDDVGSELTALVEAAV